MGPEEHLIQARGYLELGLADEARDELDKIYGAKTDSPEAMALRIDILIALSNFDGAIAIGVGCCHKWRENCCFFLRTGDALIKAKDYEHALSVLKNAPDSLHKNPEYHFALATCFTRTEKIDEAKRALKQCVALDRSYTNRFFEMLASDELQRAIGQLA
jgi:predicted Zn-dependent protease